MPTDHAARVPVAQLAKGALRRLALARLEPTPANFASAYAEESGEVPTAAHGGEVAPSAASPSVAWGAIIERVMRSLERGGRQWTAARRKESLHRVLDSSRADEARLAQRVQVLLDAWESDKPLPGIDTAAADGPDAEAQAANASKALLPEHDAGPTVACVAALSEALAASLASAGEGAADMARRLTELPARLAEGGGPGQQTLCQQIVRASDDAKRILASHGKFVDQLHGLCEELTHGLVEMAEDGSWVRGQSEALRKQLRAANDAGALRDVSEVLAQTRVLQAAAKRERAAAQGALRELLAGMVDEVGALQQHAGGFESAIERHAHTAHEADSLEDLASVVQGLLADSRQIRTAVATSNQRLQRDHARAQGLQTRVDELESKLRQLSDEASTDALTQVANRRGLEQRFATESEAARREGVPLAVALLDVDNFKKLNDRLGHAAGDTALKTLAAAVRERLRPEDHVARFGGEEFAVLLRGLPLPEAQQALTRLQRSLSAGLFLHEGEEVFVTFSAGVTLWREGETLDATVERADTGLYEAKRSGKNRTCVA